MRADPTHYATYFDRHYLTRGLALYRSLVRHSPPFVLWVLCLDDETYATLSKLRLDNVVLIPLPELERADPALLEVKPTRQPLEYYWTCGPAFLAHLLAQHPPIELLTYLDADLFFFGDPTPIYDSLGAGSILLIQARRSRQARLAADPLNRKGAYNVGLLVFRRTTVGLACLRRWREQCLDWCFDRLEPTRFGDQKYLDDWPSRYAGVVVLQHEGAGLAPWNVGNYRFRSEGSRVFVDTNPLVFYHFTELRVITRWLYDPGLWRFRETMDPTVKRYIYLPYVRELRAAAKLIHVTGGRVHPVDTLNRRKGYGQSRLLLLARMLRHHSFLVASDAFAL